MINDHRNRHGYRAVQIPGTKEAGLTILGPTERVLRVDFIVPGLECEASLTDPDLLYQFDQGMELDPRFDMVAERYPNLEWTCQAYARAQREEVAAVS